MRAYRETWLGVEMDKEESFSEINEGQYQTVTYEDYVEFVVEQGSLINGRKYSFDCIQTVDEFIETEDREFVYDMGLFNVSVLTNITDEGLEDLEGKQWVVRFLNTEYTDAKTNGTSSSNLQVRKDYTIVSDVSLIQLKFETDGVIYNLGVVDNMQSGDGIPDNEYHTRVSLKWWAWVLIGLAAIILCPFILVVLWWLLTHLLKGLWWLIKKPFELFRDS